MEKKKEIRFTIGDSDIWHSFYLNYDLCKVPIQDEIKLSCIIKQEQDKCRYGIAKKVEVRDEKGNLIARTEDIMKECTMTYNNV